MQEQESVKVIAARLADLAEAPRKLSFICVNDGYSYVLKDDGGSVIRNGGVQPNAHRQRIIELADKADKAQRKTWFAGERIVGADGEASYKPKPIPAIYAGDPLAAFQVLDDAAIARIKENQKKRDIENVKAIENKGEAIAKQLAVVAKQAEKHAPRLQRASAKAGE